MNSRLYHTVHNLLEQDSARKHPQLINSDKKLLLAVWAQEGLKLTPEQKAAFMACSPAESITRARRHMSAEFPVTSEVVAVRRALRTTTALAFKGSRKSTIFDKLQIVNLRGNRREVVALVRGRNNAARVNA